MTQSLTDLVHNVLATALQPGVQDPFQQGEAHRLNAYHCTQWRRWAEAGLLQNWSARVDGHS